MRRPKSRFSIVVDWTNLTIGFRLDRTSKYAYFLIPCIGIRWDYNYCLFGCKFGCWTENLSPQARGNRYRMCNSCGRMEIGE